MTPHIVIVGSGIAGLTLAIACRRAGYEVTILERSTKVVGLGGGLILYPYSIRLLHRLGLGERIAPLDVRLSGYQACGVSGKLLLSDTIDEFAKVTGYPIIPILRSDLLETLASELPPECIHFGARIAEIRCDEKRASVHLDDGRTFVGDLVVGADGIHSRVRQCVEESKLAYTGLTFWGGVLSGRDCLPLPERSMKWWFGVGLTCCLWPLPDDRQWWYIMARISENEIDRHAADKLHQVQELCNGWSPDINCILSAPQNSHNFVEPVWEVLPMSCWRNGRAVLIGDAVHAIGPATGQGANLAIEDAFALACCLAVYPTDFDYALTRYEEIRRPVVEYIRQFEARSAAIRVSADPLVIRQREETLRAGSVIELLRPLVTVCQESTFESVAEYTQCQYYNAGTSQVPTNR